MKLRRLIAGLAAAMVLAVSSAVPALAATGKSSKSSSTKNSATSSAASSGTITTTSNSVQGYAATAALEIGTIVQLTNPKANQVEPATQANQAHMYGVVVDPHLISITFASTALANEAYVATAGTWSVLVSTQGGTIKTGDYLTLSAVDGVAMEAPAGNGTVFGRAAANFDGKGDGIGSVTLKDTNGQGAGTATLGIIPVTIDIRPNPVKKSTKVNAPNFLQKVGLAIADKPVSAFRIYLSVVITILTIIVAIAMLSSGVRSAIFSIGRNPLSKKTIIRALFTVILASVIVLTIGLFAVYLILKL